MNYKKIPIFNYNKLDYHNRVAVIFMVSGFIMAFIASLTNVIFGIPFLINAPNILVMLLSLTLILFFPHKIKDLALIFMILSAIIYLPYNYFTGGGYMGSVPIYFVMIMVYMGLYLKSNKSTVLMLILFIVFFTVIILFSYFNPSSVTLFESQFSMMLDTVVGMILVSFNIILISRVTVNRYVKERDENEKLVFELERKNDELKLISATDSLTGIYNRGYFMKTLQHQLDLIKNTNDHIAAMMIDVDLFKEINDTWGHLYGDLILQKIADVIVSNVREQDVVARFGGDEFVVMLHVQDKASTLKIAERIKEAVEQLKLREKHDLSISIGISDARESDSIHDLLKRADDHIYQAKNQGRNKIVYQ